MRDVQFENNALCSIDVHLALALEDSSCDVAHYINYQTVCSVLDTAAET